MVLLYSSLAMIAGLLLAVQGPVNTALSRHTGKYLATLVSFSGGLLALVILVPVFGNGDLRLLGSASPWQFLGGAYGAFGVCVSIAAIPVLGVALTLMVSLLGQLVTAVFIDCYGLLGQQVVGISALRLFGIIAVTAGIILLYAANKQAEKSRKTAMGQLPMMVFLVFLSGVGGAIQSPTNASLAAIIGQLESTLISFIGGTVIIGLVVLIAIAKDPPAISAGTKPWMVIGGLFGVCAIFLNLISVVKLGAALQVTCGLLGQLAAGIIIDSLGLIETPRRKIIPLRAAGIAAVAAGVLLVTLAKLR